MNVLLLLPLLLAAAGAIPLLGKEQCAHGPTVWCRNVQSASQCGAVKHCQQTVWKQPTAEGMPCELCKEVIAMVDNFLKDNTTEAEILSYLEKACELVPDATLSAECKEAVDDYFPEIMNIIKQALDNPGVPCSAIGLCRSQQQQLAKEKLVQLQTNEIPQISVPKIEYPFIANLPLLFPEDQPQQQDVDVCQSCITFVKDVDAAVEKNTSFVVNYIANLKKQCDRLGAGLAEQCKDYISQYAGMAVQLLTQTKPSELCCMAGFCGQEYCPPSVPLQSLVPAEVIPAVKLEKAIQKSDPQMKNGLQCKVCEVVVEKLVSMLEDNSTEAQIEDTLKKVCDLLPAQYAEQCKDIVDVYGNALIQLLLEEADPKTICCVLGLCARRTKMQNAIISQEKLKSGGFCDTCKMLVMYLDRILEKNSTQTEIEAALEKICNFFPESMQSECDQYVEQYEPELVQFLLILLDPSFVCVHVGACSSAAKPLLGTEECTRGPSYWCKDLETATKCNAIEHCKRHIWN